MEDRCPGTSGKNDGYTTAKQIAARISVDMRAFRARARIMEFEHGSAEAAKFLRTARDVFGVEMQEAQLSAAFARGGRLTRAQMEEVALRHYQRKGLVPLSSLVK